MSWFWVPNVLRIGQTLSLGVASNVYADPESWVIGEKTQTITTMLYVLSCFGAMTKIMYTDVSFIG